MQDLIVMTACSQQLATIRAIIPRFQSLGTRRINAQFCEHNRKDPGCLGGPEEILRSQAKLYARAIVIFDKHGCGHEMEATRELERRCESKLALSGWENRSRAIVIDPELEAWVWSDSPQVDAVLGWSGQIPGLRTWLEDEGLVSPGEIAPSDPKTALERALKQSKKKRTSAIYQQLAKCVSFDRCRDKSFLRLRKTLVKWFPPGPSERPHPCNVPN